MKQKLIILISIIFPIFTLIGFKVHSQTSQSVSKIFINEIFANPDGTDTGKEWIEIFNASTDEINLKDWKIISESETGTKREIILPEYTIKPNEFLIILEDDSIFSGANKIKPALGAINLFNSNSNTYLVNNSKTTIDLINYQTADSGKSLERQGPIDSAECKSLITNLTGNSIGAENLNKTNLCFGILEPEIDPTIQISEVYPSPATGQNEWLEFFNFGDTDLNLKNWRLTDESGSFYIFNIDFIIPSKSHKTIDSKSLIISLNNSGDKIILTNPKNELIDEFIYDSTKTGESRSRIFIEATQKYETIYANNFVPATAILTPDSKNSFEAPLEVNEKIETGKVAQPIKESTQSNPSQIQIVKIEYKIPEIISVNLNSSFIESETKYKIALWPFYLLILMLQLFYISIVYRKKIIFAMLKYKSDFNKTTNNLLTLNDILISK